MKVRVRKKKYTVIIYPPFESTPITSIPMDWRKATKTVHYYSIRGIKAEMKDFNG